MFFSPQLCFFFHVWCFIGSVPSWAEIDVSSARFVHQHLNFANTYKPENFKNKKHQRISLIFKQQYKIHCRWISFTCALFCVFFCIRNWYRNKYWTSNWNWLMGNMLNAFDTQEIGCFHSEMSVCLSPISISLFLPFSACMENICFMHNSYL